MCPVAMGPRFDSCIPKSKLRDDLRFVGSGDDSGKEERGTDT